MYKKDLALNDLLVLICLKNNQPTNQPTNRKVSTYKQAEEYLSIYLSNSCTYSPMIKKGDNLINMKANLQNYLTCSFVTDQ